MPHIALDNPAYYLNPQLSWLSFNRRVLEEAEDEGNPVLERLKFLAITASNLDEFFEVRIAALLQRIEDGYSEASPDGMSAVEERDALARATHDFVDAQYRCWNQSLGPALARAGVRLLGLHELSPEARAFLAQHVEREVDPLLTPVTVDPAHPFPRVGNKSLCIGLLLRRRRRAAATCMGVVTVPRVLPRFVKVPAPEGEDHYVALADVVSAHAVDMFRGYDLLSSAAFRVTRNSNLYLEEEETRDLAESVRTELRNRRKGDAVRLEIEADADPEIVARLRETFELENWQVFRTEGPVNLSRLFAVYGATHRPRLKFRPFVARELRPAVKSWDLFDEIRARDVLLHHPFDAFDPVVSFVESAAHDPNVLSLKQTLYRTGEDSPIVAALVEAAAAGKEVTAVLELKARFDEATNLRWTRSLQDAGVQVYHGLVGLKTHAKLALLARRDADGRIRHYAHLGTGNYNPETARTYTDLSLFTADPELTAAVHDVFHFLTANAEGGPYSPLLVAPLDLGQKMLELIARETEHARNRRPAHIIAKVNALTDSTIIRALYEASRAGARVDLIVRGMCMLRPGIRGVSQRIHVRSVVGRFLEHSRIFYFVNGGKEEVYLGSADWMPRNLYGRVEVVFPIKDARLRQRVRQEILDTYLADTAKARILQPDGAYVRSPQRPGKARHAQEELIAMAASGARPVETPRRLRARAGARK